MDCLYITRNNYRDVFSRWKFKRGIPYYNGRGANLRQAQVCRRILRCGLSKRYEKDCCRGAVSVAFVLKRNGDWVLWGITSPPRPFCSQPHPIIFLQVCFLLEKNNKHLHINMYIRLWVQVVTRIDPDLFWFVDSLKQLC